RRTARTPRPRCRWSPIGRPHDDLPRGVAMMAAALTVTAMTLGELVGPGAGALASTPIRDLVLDSRAVQPGAAFVALRGARDHGLRHAADALARAAQAVPYDPAELGSAALPAL